MARFGIVELTPYFFLILTLFTCIHGQNADSSNLIKYKADLMNGVRKRFESGGPGISADKFKNVGLPPPHQVVGANQPSNLAPVFGRTKGVAENVKQVAPDLPPNYDRRVNQILKTQQANAGEAPPPGQLPPMKPGVPRRDPNQLPFGDNNLPNSNTDTEDSRAVPEEPELLGPGEQAREQPAGDIIAPNAAINKRVRLFEPRDGDAEVAAPIGRDNQPVRQAAPQEPEKVVVPSHRDSLSERFKSGNRLKEGEELEQARLDRQRPQSNARQFQPGKAMKIADHPACKGVVESLCRSNKEVNFAVLDCLQNRPKEVEVPKECQHFIWQFKHNLTIDQRFDSAAREICSDPLHVLTECAALQRGMGHLIPCLIDHKVNISDHNCRQFLNKMSSIVFADYRLMSRFTDACNDDILQKKCGRLDNDEEDTTSQGKTIRCLSEKLGQLDRKCRHEILRVAELQSDDFHQDRQLFFACRDDRERFCSNVAAGSGKVFRCLFKHKFVEDMTEDCRSMLTLRQQLIQADYKVHKTFADACRDDIEQKDCLAETQGSSQTVKMSIILMCLETAHKTTNDVSPECIGEMSDFRKGLMEDYKVSPNLVAMCGKEINTYCGGGIEREGKTLHCLMDLARPDRKSGTVIRFSPKIGVGCLKELKQLVVEADIGEDYRLDRALQDACQTSVDILCPQINPGGARILSCLMSHIESDQMTDECEERLMQVQYFVARDFRLDYRMFRHCRHDVRKFCSASKPSNPADPGNPGQAPLILMCLYHHMTIRLQDQQLKKNCAIEVRRVMRERAVSVDLEPRIEEHCMKDLAVYCSKDTERGMEVECLQDRMVNLTSGCRSAVESFTEDEDEDPQLDRILIKACTPMIKEFCEEKINKNTEPTDVMECLIKYVYNPRMDPKCAAGINHHMILTMTDFRFNWKFKELCKNDVMEHCKGMKSKADVVYCLSDCVHNDTLLGRAQRVSLLCRKQLRYEKLQMSSSIDLSPRLKKSCEYDIYTKCRDVSHGQGRVIECLKRQRKELKERCYKLIFKREKEEMEDNSIDFPLMHSCKNEIREYCEDTEPSMVLDCLKKHKGAVDFEPKCRRIVIRRMEIANEDYRLNRKLKKTCKQDMPKHCSKVLKTQENDKYLEGKMINCLKVKYRQNKLSDSCEQTISNIIREASMDYRQDPVLSNACSDEIRTMCADQNETPDEETKGKVQECLKLKFKQRLIQNKDCQREVLRIIAEGKADIHVDPLLHKSCSLDIKHYCFKVPPGEGRQMSCLLAALDDKQIKLTSECYKMLSDRVQMWEYAAKVAPPETLNEIITQMSSSPSRHYFIGVLFMLIGMIFIGGLFCGRITKKLRKDAKNK